MDQVYIQALLRKALIAYAQGGTEALDRWKNDLPPDQLAQLEEHCAGPLSEAIAALAPVLGEVKRDPRKTHRVDRRRTKPL